MPTPAVFPARVMIGWSGVHGTRRQLNDASVLQVRSFGTKSSHVVRFLILVGDSSRVSQTPSALFHRRLPFVGRQTLCLEHGCIRRLLAQFADRIYAA